MMHTALTTLQKEAEKIGPEKLKEIGGVKDVELGKNSSILHLEKAHPRPIYRIHPGGDRWACHDCKDRGDKWYMQDHHCSRPRISIKQDHRKAARIKRLQMENERIV